MQTTKALRTAVLDQQVSLSRAAGRSTEAEEVALTHAGAASQGSRFRATGRFIEGRGAEFQRELSRAR